MAEACDFRETYERVRLPVMRELERRFLGGDYGGTSWTTRSQAEEIANFLQLQAGVQLLDVGAGAGWPSLFLAHATGCGVTLLDLPVNALQSANQRAAVDGIAQRIQTLVGSGAALPLADGAFDAVAHADVLCCMPEKESMLRECRRVVRGGGRMLFSVISTAPSLSEADYREAVEAGPPFIETSDDYAVLISDAGWRVLERIDVTKEYGNSLQALLTGVTEMADALMEAIGINDYDDMQQRRAFQFDAHGRGLLRREIFVSVAG
jgi:2-polyprenyl-3-methyl-5-hydroxy-6-metoxy-1,4-benzoquinol methylase